MTPKAFISYSWTSQEHQALIKSWADQLIADGIEIIFDLYDLKEGSDKFAFMERMVTDPEISHVLVFSDSKYAEKANNRQAGVGTESQIISKSVYEKVEQSKFIPIVCEFNEANAPCLPTFLESRIWIDFSSPEAVNKNWEQLVRVLFGKPQHIKPERGTPPIYVLEDASVPSSPAISKYRILRQAILEGRPNVIRYREDFLSACLGYADEMRVRKQPNTQDVGKQILDTCSRLKIVRNQLVDWLLLESSMGDTYGFPDSLVGVMEQLLEIKSRPPEVTQWNDSWFDAHSLFVYETFIYIIAGLLKAGQYQLLHELFTTHYLSPKTERDRDRPFETFDAFYGSSEAVQPALSPDGKQRYYSAGAEIIHRQADREDIPFSALIEAELLIVLMTLITPEVRWYPGTLHYSRYGRDYPFFLRSAQHKGFRKLAIITGVDSADELRNIVKKRIEEMRDSSFSRFDRSFWSAMNMEMLDTIK